MNHPSLEAHEATTTPPIEHSEIVEPESTWPRNLGIFAIVYSILGMTCMGLSVVGMIIMPFLPEMFGGGLETPRIVLVTQVVMAVLALIAGLLLLRAGIGVLKRRRAGVVLMKAWVVYRLVLVLVGVTIFVITMPAQLQAARERSEFRNERLVESGQPERELPDDEALLRQLTIPIVAGSVIVSIAPFVIGFYLSRRKITEEVAQWP